MPANRLATESSNVWWCVCRSGWGGGAVGMTDMLLNFLHVIVSHNSLWLACTFKS